jgi:ABC-type Mn2+/Zn2+ transport system permease subunit
VIELLFPDWDLFRDFYIAGWLSSVLLALAGVYVVARNQVFLGAALSQASTLGLACAYALATAWGSAQPWLETHEFLTALGMAFPVAAAFLAAGGHWAPETQEALCAWIFLGASSLSVLIASYDPHGLEKMQSLVFSSTIIASKSEHVFGFAAMALATAAAAALARDRLALLAMDPAMAAAVGMRVRRWSAWVHIWLGLVIGFSLHVAGTLYTFGCLVLPALVAKNLVRESRPVFLLAPAIALATTLIGLPLAHHRDLPPALLPVGILSAMLALTWLRPRR